MGRKLHLSRTNKMIAGVCGGLGEYFKVDPTLIRIAFTILFFITFSSGALFYIVLWAVLPLDS